MRLAIPIIRPLITLQVDEVWGSEVTYPKITPAIERLPPGKRNAFEVR
jgi:hypothetical protein